MKDEVTRRILDRVGLLCSLPGRNPGHIHVADATDVLLVHQKSLDLCLFTSKER